MSAESLYLQPTWMNFDPSQRINQALQSARAAGLAQRREQFEEDQGQEAMSLREQEEARTQQQYQMQAQAAAQRAAAAQQMQQELAGVTDPKQRFAVMSKYSFLFMGSPGGAAMINDAYKSAFPPAPKTVATPQPGPEPGSYVYNGKLYFAKPQKPAPASPEFISFDQTQLPPAQTGGEPPGVVSGMPIDSPFHDPSKGGVVWDRSTGKYTVIQPKTARTPAPNAANDEEVRLRDVIKTLKNKRDEMDDDNPEKDSVKKQLAAAEKALAEAAGTAPPADASSTDHLTYDPATGDFVSPRKTPPATPAPPAGAVSAPRPAMPAPPAAFVPSARQPWMGRVPSWQEQRAIEAAQQRAAYATGAKKQKEQAALIASKLHSWLPQDWQ